jgi:hypothetical protein
MAVLLMLSGCRTSQSTEARLSSLGFVQPTSRSSDVLGSVEIETARVNNAHEAVMRLRPEFLRQRSRPSKDDPSGALPMVYVNGVRQGGPDMLRSIPVAAILDIRYLTPTTASDQFGPYYPAGVIAVRTRR